MPYVCRSPRISPSAISMSTSETSLREEDSDIFAAAGTPSKQSPGSGSPAAAFTPTSSTAAAEADSSAAAQLPIASTSGAAATEAGRTSQPSAGQIGKPCYSLPLIFIISTSMHGLTHASVNSLSVDVTGLRIQVRINMLQVLCCLQ